MLRSSHAARLVLAGFLAMILAAGHAYAANPPAIKAFTLLDPTPTSLDTVQFKVDFTQPVTGVDATDFWLHTNLKNSGIVSVSGWGEGWTVTINTGVGSGYASIHLYDDDTIKNSAGEPLGGPGTGNLGASAPYFLVRPKLTAVRMDANWGHSFRTTSDTFAFAADLAADCNYFFAGGVAGIGAGKHDVYLVKVNKLGYKLWERTYGGAQDDYARSLQATADGGCVLAGSTRSVTAGGEDAYVIKVDAAGNKTWERKIGETGDEGANMVQQLKDGGYIVAGYWNSTAITSSTREDVRLIRLNAQGGILWRNTYRKPGDECAMAVQQMADGGFVLAGRSDSGGGGKDAVYVVRTDADGKTLWEKTIGGTQDRCARACRQAADGGILLAGFIDTGAASKRDGFLIKLDGKGAVLWTKIFGGARDEELNAVMETPDQFVYAAGYTQSNDIRGMYDCLLARVGKDGNNLSTCTLYWTKDDMRTLDSEVWSIRMADRDRVILAGSLMPYAQAPGPRCAFIADLYALLTSRDIAEFLVGRASVSTPRQASMDVTGDSAITISDVILMVNREHKK